MKNRVILLVEDSPDDALLVKRALKENQITNKIIVVIDGQEAIDFLHGKQDGSGSFQNELPALVLLDLKLPKIDGIEVLRQIRKNERTKFIPTVILTSSSEEDDIIKSYKSGCNSYLRKPIEFDEFSEAIKSVGLYWLILNEIPHEWEENNG